MYFDARFRTVRVSRFVCAEHQYDILYHVDAYVRILNILILLIVVRYSQLGGVVFSSGRVRVSP